MDHNVVAIVFAGVALVFSVFYGFWACPIFGVNADQQPLPWKIHQVWFNFLGAAVGWSALWILLDRNSWFSSGSRVDLNVSDGSLFVVALLGMTGHLPRSLFGVVQALGDVAVKLIGFAEKKGTPPP